MVSIIFPAFNNWHLTRDCLKSIAKLKFPKNQLEVIVVDNASIDNTVNLIRKTFPHVLVLPQKTNLGFAKAVNLGAKKAQGEYLFITNNDVTFTPDFLIDLSNFMSKDPHIGVSGGKIQTEIAGRKFIDGPANINILTSGLKRLKNYQKIQTVDYISGAGLLIKRKIFEILSGFDEHFPFYFEDLDLCLRVKRLGLNVTYFPKAVMYHKQASSVSQRGKSWQNQVWYLGKIRLINKHFPYWAKATSITAQILFSTYVTLTKRQDLLSPLISALKNQTAHTEPSAVKKRGKITKSQIHKYYESGDVFTARNSAPFQQVVLRDFYQLLSTNYPTKKWHILEFGVGHGWNLPQMTKYFGKITAVDVTQIAVNESREYGFKNVTLKKVGGTKLPFGNNTFDLIVAAEVLEHVPDLKVTSGELKRITKPGGFILVSVPVYLNLRGISKSVMEKILGTGTWEPARSHPGGFERMLTPNSIRSYFKDFKIIKTQGADYGTAWSLPTIPLYPKSWAPFFEITLGKIPIIKNFGMNYCFLVEKT